LEVYQTFVLGSGDCVWADPEALGRTPQQGQVPDRLGRCQQQQPLSLMGERKYSTVEALFDPAVHGPGVGEAEAASQLCRCPPPGELRESQRIAVRLGDDAVPHLLV
jgi:hypothetical protein